MLDVLPEGLCIEWRESPESREATPRESSIDSQPPETILRCALHGMFSSEHNRLDTLRFMREQKIVVLCLAPENRLSPQDQNTIAGLTVNEFLATARSLRRIRKMMKSKIQSKSRINAWAVESPALHFAAAALDHRGPQMGMPFWFTFPR